MKTITINNKSLSYQDSGEGFPILFGHSYLWNAAMWQPQIAALSKHYRCLVPELWAHGGSGNLDAYPYSIESLAEDYWQFMSALGLKKFAIVGLSVGGMWGTQLTVNHPEAVAALVVMNSFVGTEPEVSRQYYFSLMDAIEKSGGISAPMKEVVTPFFFSPDTLHNNLPLVRHFHTILDSYTPDQIKGIIALGKGIFSRHSLLEKLPEIKAPTLIMAGEYDKSRPPHESRIMAGAIPGARLDIIPNAGHISNLEQPDYVNTKLLDFFRDSLRETSIAGKLAMVDELY